MMIQILTACGGLPSHDVAITKSLDNLRLATKISFCVAILRLFTSVSLKIAKKVLEKEGFGTR